jgi:hypothetical protein
MKRRKSRNGPPGLGGYRQADIVVCVSEEEKAGRPLAPLIVYAEPRPDFDAMAKAIEEGRFVPGPAAHDGLPGVDLTPAGPPPIISEGKSAG